MDERGRKQGAPLVGAESVQDVANWPEPARKQRLILLFSSLFSLLLRARVKKARVECRAGLFVFFSLNKSLLLGA